jgi:hypothetical protein
MRNGNCSSSVSAAPVCTILVKSKPANCRF